MGNNTIGIIIILAFVAVFGGTAVAEGQAVGVAGGGGQALAGGNSGGQAVAQAIVGGSAVAAGNTGVQVVGGAGGQAGGGAIYELQVLFRLSVGGRPLAPPLLDTTRATAALWVLSEDDGLYLLTEDGRLILKKAIAAPEPWLGLDTFGRALVVTRGGQEPRLEALTRAGNVAWSFGLGGWLGSSPASSQSASQLGVSGGTPGSSLGFSLNAVQLGAADGTPGAAGGSVSGNGVGLASGGIPGVASKGAPPIAPPIAQSGIPGSGSGEVPGGTGAVESFGRRSIDSIAFGPDGRCLLVSGRRLLCLSAGGRMLWRFELPSESSCVPVFEAGGNFIIGMNNGMVLAISPYGEVVAGIERMIETARETTGGADGTNAGGANGIKAGGAGGTKAGGADGIKAGGADGIKAGGTGGPAVTALGALDGLIVIGYENGDVASAATPVSTQKLVPVPASASGEAALPKGSVVPSRTISGAPGSAIFLGGAGEMVKAGDKANAREMAKAGGAIASIALDYVPTKTIASGFLPAAEDGVGGDPGGGGASRGLLVFILDTKGGLFALNAGGKELWKVATGIPSGSLFLARSRIVVVGKGRVASYSRIGEALREAAFSQAVGRGLLAPSGLLFSAGADWVVSAFRYEGPLVPIVLPRAPGLPADRSAVAALGAFAAGPSAEDREMAIVADIEKMVEAGGPGSKEAGDRAVLEAIAKGTIPLSGEIVTQLRFRLFARPRIEACRVLGEIGSPESIDALADIALAGGDPSVKAAAYRAIAAIGVDPDGRADKALAAAGFARLDGEVAFALVDAIEALALRSGQTLGVEAARSLVSLSGPGYPSVVRARAMDALARIVRGSAAN